MTAKLRLLYIGVFLFFVTPHLFSQNDSCVESIPICGDPEVVYTSLASGDAEYGPYYGCLSSQPNPNWFYMRIDNAGEIVLYIEPSDEGSYESDYDVICWGSFDNPFAACTDGLTEESMIDCSYSSSDYETCVIPEANSGEYYIIMVTRIGGSAFEGFTIGQYGGDGSLDNSIVSPEAFSNSPVCDGESLLLSTNVDGALYSWTGPNGFISNEQNPELAFATIENSGNYELSIELDGVLYDTISTEVMVVEKPVITVSENIALPYNTSTQLHCYAENGAPDYSFFWTPAESLQETNVADPYTIDLIQSTTFNVYVRDNNHCTSNTEQIEVTITSGVNASNLISDSEIEVYPNPASNEISVQLPDDFKEGRVEIYQTDGTLVFSENIAGKNSFIDVSEFSRGSYLIRVSSESKVYQKKIVLIK